MSSQCDPEDREPSLVLSALSSPLATSRSRDTHFGVGEDTLTEASTRLGNKILMAQVDISECLAPLEQRFEARLKALEASLDQRCSALEAKGSRPSGVTSVTSGDASSTHRNLKVLQEQMEATTYTVQGFLESEAVKLASLSEELRRCIDRQSTLQCNIDELWHQVKADRQDSLNRHRVLADTTELRLQSAMKVGQCSCATGILSDELPGARGPPDGEEVTWNTGVERRHSGGTKAGSPRTAMIPALRSPPSSPLLAQRMSASTQRLASAPSTTPQSPTAGGRMTGMSRNASTMGLQQRQQQQPPQQGGKAVHDRTTVMRRMTSAPHEALRTNTQRFGT